MGGFGRNRLSRRGNFHLTGGRTSCSICGLVPPLRQYHAFLCRPAGLASLTATAMGRHAGTGRGRPLAGPRRVPDLLRRDHVGSPASEPASALIGAEEAQADRRPHGLRRDNSTPVHRTRARGRAGPPHRDRAAPTKIETATTIKSCCATTGSGCR